MTSFNRVILMGNLTRDPEIRYMPNGTAVAALGLAVNRRYRQGEEMKEEVGFFDIVVFGKQAENCGQYLTKGRGVLVEGRLQQRRWETEDGQKRSKIEVVALNVQFMPARTPTSVGAGGQAEAPPAETGGVEESDIPF